MKYDVKLAPYGNMLLFKNGYTAEFVEKVIKEMNLDGLRIFDDLDPHDSTKFLKDFVFLRKLNMHIAFAQDYSFLEYLENLEDLNIGDTYNLIGVIDLKNLIKLKDFGVQWKKGKILNIQNCINIESIFIDSFNESDLSIFGNNTKIKSFRMKVGKISSLKGIDKFKNLQFLELANCPKLTDISDIHSLKEIKNINLYNCSKVFDFDILAELPNLESLSIDNCKDIKSIKFIDKLEKIKILSVNENTNILDGDTIPAKRLEEFYSMHRKHYNEKVINPIIEERRKRNIAKIKSMYNL